jgi:hypothetical protein
MNFAVVRRCEEVAICSTMRQTGLYGGVLVPRQTLVVGWYWCGSGVGLPAASRVNEKDAGRGQGVKETMESGRLFLGSGREDVGLGAVGPL